MAKQSKIDRVWDIIEKVGVCMLTTQFAKGLRARPLAARRDSAADVIWFVTDLRSGKEHEIEVEHDVGLVFIDANENACLSITARAEVRRDRAKTAEIWKKTDDMWWDGPDDPNVCVLRVQPLTAEFWDGPASAAVTARNLCEWGEGRGRADPPRLDVGPRINLGPHGRIVLPPQNRNLANVRQRVRDGALE